MHGRRCEERTGRWTAYPGGADAARAKDAAVVRAQRQPPHLLLVNLGQPPAEVIAVARCIRNQAGLREEVLSGQNIQTHHFTRDAQPSAAPPSPIVNICERTVSPGVMTSPSLPLALVF